MCWVRWIAEPDDRILLTELVKFKSEMTAVAIKEEKPILPNRPTPRMFVKNLC
jgi:hypothetical protein